MIISDMDPCERFIDRGILEFPIRHDDIVELNICTFAPRLATNRKPPTRPPDSVPLHYDELSRVEPVFDTSWFTVQADKTDGGTVLLGHRSTRFPDRVTTYTSLFPDAAELFATQLLAACAALKEAVARDDS